MSLQLCVICQEGPLEALFGNLGLVECVQLVEVTVDDDTLDLLQEDGHALETQFVARCFDEVPDDAQASLEVGSVTQSM